MKLFQLAYICGIYGATTKPDGDYFTFTNQVGGRLDFRDNAHMKALLVWLNSWGCRQFAIDDHNLAISSIREWATQKESMLPHVSMGIEHLSSQDIEMIGVAYSDLSTRVASRRVHGEKIYDVRIGATGAAKILFAARPKAIPPWDEPYRAYFKLDDSNASFCQYLTIVQAQVRELCTEAAGLGIRTEDLLLEIGKPGLTFPKLIDEYNWITITRKTQPAKPQDIAKWYRWSQQRERARGHEARKAVESEN